MPSPPPWISDSIAFSHAPQLPFVPDLSSVAYGTRHRRLYRSVQNRPNQAP
jgi:hypothetical protein